MIPQKIHYVWMGKKPKPRILKHCIKTWRKNLPNWEIIEWNEDNFPISSHPFVEQAYKQQEWAFVSDYVRAWAIYHHGGIYLDTDVVVIRNLNPLRKNQAFVGFESEQYPFTAVFGAVAKHPLIKTIMSSYDNPKKSQYEFQDNNTISVSSILIKKYHCIPNNKTQLLEDGIKVYPDGILCNPSPKSYTVHLFYGGWKNSGRNFSNKIREVLRGYILTTPRRLELYFKVRRKND